MVSAAAGVGKDKRWGELSGSERSAAACLGYDAPSWEQGIVLEVCLQRWGQLDDWVADAARVLG